MATNRNPAIRPLGTGLNRQTQRQGQRGRQRADTPYLRAGASGAIKQMPTRPLIGSAPGIRGATNPQYGLSRTTGRAVGGAGGGGEQGQQGGLAMDLAGKSSKEKAEYYRQRRNLNRVSEREGRRARKLEFNQSRQEGIRAKAMARSRDQQVKNLERARTSEATLDATTQSIADLEAAKGTMPEAQFQRQMDQLLQTQRLAKQDSIMYKGWSNEKFDSALERAGTNKTDADNAYAASRAAKEAGFSSVDEYKADQARLAEAETQHGRAVELSTAQTKEAYKGELDITKLLTDADMSKHGDQMSLARYTADLFSKNQRLDKDADLAMKKLDANVRLQLGKMQQDGIKFSVETQKAIEANKSRVDIWGMKYNWLMTKHTGRAKGLGDALTLFNKTGVAPDGETSEEAKARLEMRARLGNFVETESKNLMENIDDPWDKQQERDANETQESQGEATTTQTPTQSSGPTGPPSDADAFGQNPLDQTRSGGMNRSSTDDTYGPASPTDPDRGKASRGSDRLTRTTTTKPTKQQTRDTEDATKFRRQEHRKKVLAAEKSLRKTAGGRKAIRMVEWFRRAVEINPDDLNYKRDLKQAEEKLNRLVKSRMSKA